MVYRKLLRRYDIELLLDAREDFKDMFEFQLSATKHFWVILLFRIV